MNSTYVVGIDVGGQTSKIGVVDARGTVLAQTVIRTDTYTEIAPFIAELAEAVNKVIKERNILTQTLKKEPTSQELADYLGTTKEKIEYLLQISQDILSLDQTIDEDEDIILSDTIPDNSMVNPGEYLENAEYRAKIDKMLKTLTPREERIIRLRYGLDDNVVHTLEDIAKEFDITRERVRQLEIKAIRRLRHPSRIKIIKEK